MSTLNPAGSGKIVPRIATIHVDRACNAFLHDCFKQFGSQVESLQGDPAASLQRQKFEGCVVRLYDPEAEKILSAIRSSSSNRSLVVYGIARNGKEALRYSRLGINAVLDEPLDRSNVLKVVRATRLLVMNELRRYVRVPIVSEALVETLMGRAPVTTVEVSSGGLSVKSRSALPTREPVKVGLDLPGLQSLNLRAYVCWGHATDKLYGLCFDSGDSRRFRVRNWIEEYLETA